MPVFLPVLPKSTGCRLPLPPPLPPLPPRGPGGFARVGVGGSPEGPHGGAALEGDELLHELRGAHVHPFVLLVVPLVLVQLLLEHDRELDTAARGPGVGGLGVGAPVRLVAAVVCRLAFRPVDPPRGEAGLDGGPLVAAGRSATGPGRASSRQGLLSAGVGAGEGPPAAPGDDREAAAEAPAGKARRQRGRRPLRPRHAVLELAIRNRGKGEHVAIVLGEGELGPARLVEEGKSPRLPEAGPHRKILLGAARAVRVRVVVEGFPVGAVAVEVKPRREHFHVEEGRHPINHLIEGGRPAWVLVLQVAAPLHHPPSFRSLLPTAATHRRPRAERLQVPREALAEGEVEARREEVRQVLAVAVQHRLVIF
mmetsp:Transcript_9956/g.22876  ORF Transcript_9956/g.22876 Transcript_9956/m.22876 type:complete len:367 (-) Transcript_9956:274-1374(-)